MFEWMKRLVFALLTVGMCFFVTPPLFDQIKERAYAYLANRLKEPGTRVALFGLLGSLGMKISPDLGEVIIDVLTFFFLGAAAAPDARFGGVSVPPGNPPAAGSGSGDSPFMDSGR